MSGDLRLCPGLPGDKEVAAVWTIFRALTPSVTFGYQERVNSWFHGLASDYAGDGYVGVETETIRGS